MNEKREFQSPVSIAELAKREKAEAESAAQEIAGQLSQISQDQSSANQDSIPAQNPQTSSEISQIKLVQTQRPSKETKKAERQKMLRLFEKAAA